MPVVLEWVPKTITLHPSILYALRDRLTFMTALGYEVHYVVYESQNRTPGLFQ